MDSAGAPSVCVSFMCAWAFFEQCLCELSAGVVCMNSSVKAILSLFVCVCVSVYKQTVLVCINIVVLLTDDQ